MLALAIVYVLAWLLSIFMIVRILSSQNLDVLHLVLYLLYFAATWMILYLLGKRKKIGYKIIIFFESVRFLSQVVMFYFVALPFSQVLSSPLKEKYLTYMILTLVPPFVYIWLAYKSKKVLVN